MMAAAPRAAMVREGSWPRRGRASPRSGGTCGSQTPSAVTLAISCPGGVRPGSPGSTGAPPASPVVNSSARIPGVRRENGPPGRLLILLTLIGAGADLAPVEPWFRQRFEKPWRGPPGTAMLARAPLLLALDPDARLSAGRRSGRLNPDGACSPSGLDGLARPRRGPGPVSIRRRPRALKPGTARSRPAGCGPGPRRVRSSAAAAARTGPSSPDRPGWQRHCRGADGHACRSARPPGSWRGRAGSQAGSRCFSALSPAGQLPVPWTGGAGPPLPPGQRPGATR